MSHLRLLTATLSLFAFISALNSSVGFAQANQDNDADQASSFEYDITQGKLSAADLDREIHEAQDSVHTILGLIDDQALTITKNRADLAEKMAAIRLAANNSEKEVNRIQDLEKLATMKKNAINILTKLNSIENLHSDSQQSDRDRSTADEILGTRLFEQL